MLELINVKKIYTTKAGDTAAMNGISVKFPDSGMIFINGKSGSGKTTLLNVVGGLDDFDSGEIVIDGKKFSSFSPAEYDSYRNTFVGFIFQEYNLLPDYTVEKNIKIANELQGKSTTRERIAELMEEFDIAGLQNRKPSQLSGGQKQRVAIVRSLVKDPKIIMADEPTGALDSVTGVQVMETLKKLSKDKLIVVVSHDLELAEKYADRIIRLVDGEIVEDVTLTDKEITGNIHVDEMTVTVKTGASLNAHETEELLKGIRERKKINLIEKFTVRKREKTKEIVTPKYTEDVKLINSKMKYKSSAELGVKSLLVKPGRLVFTIILSVIAFAVFGLFDTVAAYQDTRAIQNLLKKSDYSAISLYSEYSPESHYYVNTDVSSRNTVKFTDADVLKLSQESGYKFRPVYDLDDSKLTMVNSVKKIENVHVGSSMATSIGALYYIPQVSGYVEFKNDELGVTEEGIVETIDQGGFNLKLVAGNFPTFVVDPVSGEANVKEIAISEYLAKSICYWNGGNSDPALMDVNLLIDTEIKVGNEFFIIKGVYNSGEIHKKYDSLKEIPLMASSLADEFETYLHAGLYFNILVPEGYIEHKMAQNGRVGGYFNLKKTYDFTFSDTSTNYTKSGSNRFYNVGDIDSSKIYMFEEERNENIELADDEVLINLENLDDIYLYEKDRAGQYLGANISKEMTELEVDLLRRNSMTMTDEMKADLKAYIGLVDRLARDYPNVVSSYIKTVDFVIFEDLLREDMRQYKIVGVYTGVDTDINKVNAVTIHPFAMTKNGLDGLKINPNQGVYGRIIAPMNTSNRATKYLSKKMTSGGIVLAWFGNNVLEIITENGEMIMQFAQLFLYVAIVLALFSVFMLYNYISASIVSKKQSIGVLRALGSGSKDIFLMFITESLIIAFINGVLASGVAALGCIFVNMYIKNVMNLTINFAIYGIRQVIIIMIASVFTAVVSSLLPIIKISKEKPVNLIREP